MRDGNASEWHKLSLRIPIVASSIPEGLFYLPEAISLAEERQCLEEIEALPFEPYVFGAYVARRKVVQFGGQERRATYGGNQPLESMPEWLFSLRQKCARLVDFKAEELAQILVARYEQAGIGWHCDAAEFGPTVIGVSLTSAAMMRFRRMHPEREDLFRLELAPRSIYIMAGDARSSWQHSLPATKTLRYSITFRTISAVDQNRSFGRSGRSLDPRHQPLLIAQCLKRNKICYQAALNESTEPESTEPESTEPESMTIQQPRTKSQAACVTQLKLSWPTVETHSQE